MAATNDLDRTHLTFLTHESEVTQGHRECVVSTSEDEMEFAVDEEAIEVRFDDEDNENEGKKELDEDWLETFSEDYEEEGEGQNIWSILAKLIKKNLKTRLSEEKMKKLLDRTLVPANVTMLTNLRVNPHI